MVKEKPTLPETNEQELVRIEKELINDKWIEIRIERKYIHGKWVEVKVYPSAYKPDDRRKVNPSNRKAYTNQTTGKDFV